MKEDIREKLKCHKIQNDKWERKQYIEKCESNIYHKRCHENQIT